LILGEILQYPVSVHLGFVFQYRFVYFFAVFLPSWQTVVFEIRFAKLIHQEVETLVSGFMPNPVDFILRFFERIQRAISGEVFNYFVVSPDGLDASSVDIPFFRYEPDHGKEYILLFWHAWLRDRHPVLVTGARFAVWPEEKSDNGQPQQACDRPKNILDEI